MNRSTCKEPLLEQLLLQEMSRRNTNLVAEVISHDPARFSQAVEIVMKEKEPVSRRAMWAIDIACEKKPGLIAPYLSALLQKMTGFRHDAFRRHILRIAARLPFQEHTKGILLTVCFDLLTDNQQAVAVKAHAMSILARLAVEEPDIRHELAETISHQLAEATPGYRSQARKILSTLKRL